MGIEFANAVKVSFGVGKVQVRAISTKHRGEVSGVVLLAEMPDAQPIGVIRKNVECPAIEDTQVSLNFANVESLDVVIGALNFLRSKFVKFEKTE